MTLLQLIHVRFVLLGLPGRDGPGRPRRDERGDVPGWVLVTIMTAGLVVVIFGVAEDELKQMLRTALNSVK